MTQPPHSPLPAWAESPVLIGGSDSSGSTFLSFYLDRHPDVVSLDELYLFNTLVAYRDRHRFRRWRHLIRQVGISSNPIDPATTTLSALDSYGLSPSRAWGWVGQAEDLSGLAARIAHHLREATGKSLWVEKTPSNARYIRWFLAAFPSGRFIHLVRDPRDVLLSLMRRHPEKGYLHGVETWLMAVCPVHAQRHDPRVLEVRYEDLVTDTAGVMHRVCAFLGVEYEASYFANTDHTTRLGPRFEGHSSWLAKPVTEASSAPVFRWKKSATDFGPYAGCRLTDEMAALLGVEARSLSDMAVQYGYEPFEASHPTPKSLLYQAPDPHRRTWPIRRLYDTGERAWSVLY